MLFQKSHSLFYLLLQMEKVYELFMFDLLQNVHMTIPKLLIKLKFKSFGSDSGDEARWCCKARTTTKLN